MKNKIILIEGNPDVRENINEILDLAGYDVRTAATGKAGIELVQQEKPHLIICEIIMPGVDGYGVLDTLSENTETAEISFIFLTTKTEKTDIRKGMNLDADDYLIKPFYGTDLLDAIEAKLRKAACYINCTREMLGGT